jgi:hypothetical protein
MRDDDKEQCGSTDKKALATPTVARWLEETTREQPYHVIKAVRANEEVEE